MVLRSEALDELVAEAEIDGKIGLSVSIRAAGIVKTEAALAVLAAGVGAMASFTFGCGVVVDEEILTGERRGTVTTLALI